jgi:uncharacterized damage-inducible protein DinB
MTANEALLESWTRQCKALDNLIGRLTPDLLKSKPSEDGWDIAFHLAHLHGTRRYWHAKAAGLDGPVGATLYKNTEKEWEHWTGTTDLDEIRMRLKESQDLVHGFVADALESSSTERSANYDHPVLYLQHMIWHEGWHFALITLAMRLAGHEPPEEWEDANVWGVWREPD